MTDNDIIQFTPCPDSDSKAHPSEMKREYEEIVQFTPVPTQESDGTENCGLEDIKLLELPPVDEMEETPINRVFAAKSLRLWFFAAKTTLTGVSPEIMTE